MSPASLDALEVERYIGACLFTNQNRFKNYHQQQPPPPYHQQNGYVNYQHPEHQWAGGAPLISFAHRRPQHHEDNPLARLAGAPLILTKSNFRKNRKQQAHHQVIPQQTKVFENSNIARKHEQGQDCVSVTSDESSGSQNSETCLPRIIKPRKRRKKERKPQTRPHHHQNPDNFHHQDESSSRASSSNNSSNIIIPTTSYNIIDPLQSLLPLGLLHQDQPKQHQYIDTTLSDICEAPRLHHSFEEVEEVEDANGNVSTCQCRYCDPESQIWDVDRSCYSPFLTPPKTFDFSHLLGLNFDDNNYNVLSDRLSTLSLKDEPRKPFFSRSTSSSSTSSSASSYTSSASSTGDLEVSTEIVTSLNGHRDLEIKFWLSESKSANDSKG